MYHRAMPNALPEVDDLTQMDATRTCVLNVELSASQVAVLREDADRRNVSLEAYVRYVALTVAAVENARNIGGPVYRGDA